MTVTEARSRLEAYGWELGDLHCRVGWSVTAKSIICQVGTAELAVAQCTTHVAALEELVELVERIGKATSC